MENLLKDSRFAHIKRDPKFRSLPKSERKVKIDKRFQSMFKDKRFTLKYTVDKRGRPVNQTSVENLRKYYDLSDTEDEEEIEKDDSEKSKKEQTSEKETGKSHSKANQEKSVESQNVNNEVEEEKDNCFSSNGELLRIKPQAEHDSDAESSRDSSHTDTEEAVQKEMKKELDENEKQLHIKEGGSKLSNEIREKLRDLTVDYARGEGVLLTESSSDEECSIENEEEDEIEHNWGELDKEAESTDEITHRLALCNMDWDRIRAVDLMVLFNSFLPGSGVIHSITIYPSEFGLQRMKEEEVKGPIELVESKKDSNNTDDDSEEDEEGSKYHMEKLRQYQLNRLKYYYAVIDCDTPETANKIYTDCDGVEYESTATKLDLRFIPDDMTFDQEPKEACTELPQLSKYQPRQFTTTALQQVKVNLTWDETNPERQEITQKLSSGKIDEVDEADIQAYLASGDSDDEEEEKEMENKIEDNDTESDSESKTDPITKYKLLLKNIEEQENAKKQKDVELEFTWGLGTVEKAEKLVNERMKKKENLTPFEQYIEKRKAKKKAKKEERKKLKDENNQTDSEDDIPSDVDLSDPFFADLKKAKSKKKKSTSKKDNNMSHTEDDEEKQQKAELELLLMDKNEDEDKQHFNMKKIEEQSTLSKSKKKRLLKKKKDLTEESKEDNFEVNVQDPRFGALFTSHHFNIDPADPHYRKTKGTEILVQEKLKRRADDNDTIVEVQPKQAKTQKKINTELQSLVKSVKKNVKNISNPIKR